MQRRPFIALMGLTLLTVETAWGQTQGGRKVSKLEGPLTVNPDDIPLPEGFSEATRARMEQRRWEILLAQRMQTLPFSEVERGADLTVYSRSVNQFTDVAFAGKTEWLGTQQGIKRVDHGRGELQLYTQEDGLPGNRVLSIVGEASEAFALIGCADGAVALCHLAPGQERWKVLFKRTKPPYSYERSGELRGEDRLVMNAEYVVFVCGARETRGEAAAPYYVYHRRRRKVTPALWDLSIRADHAFLGVTCAFLAKDKLWLGTSIGLLMVPLEPPKGPVVWQRFLPERLILDGVALTPERLALQTASRGIDVGQELAALLAFDIATVTPASLPALPPRVGRVDLCDKPHTAGHACGTTSGNAAGGVAYLSRQKGSPRSHCGGTPDAK